MMEVCRKMVEEEKPYLIDFEKTELRLGLPGRKDGDEDEDEDVVEKCNNTNFNGKRGFQELTRDGVGYLKLNLSSELEMEMDPNDEMKKKTLLSSSPKPPPSKAQVVGWPPVRSFRKNIKGVQKKRNEEGGEEKVNDNIENPTFVKVSLDGAPYLRKVDLNMYNNYRDLSDALSKLFTSFTIGKCGSEGMKEEYMKVMDVLKGSDYVQTYQDKDGDWMLVGDVPWEMFVGSCKRLRIMKGAEAIGLAPKAMEKCKNRS